MLTKSYWDDDRCIEVGLTWIQFNIGTIVDDAPLPKTIEGVEAQRAKELDGETDEWHICVVTEVVTAALRWLQATPEQRLDVVRAPLAACEEFMLGEAELEAACLAMAWKGINSYELSRRMSDALNDAMNSLGVAICSPQQSNGETHE